MISNCYLVYYASVKVEFVYILAFGSATDITSDCFSDAWGLAGSYMVFNFYNAKVSVHAVWWNTYVGLLDPWMLETQKIQPREFKNTLELKSYNLSIKTLNH